MASSRSRIRSRKRFPRSILGGNRLASQDLSSATWAAYYGIPDFPGTYPVVSTQRGPYSATAATNVITAGSAAIISLLATTSTVTLPPGIYMINSGDITVGSNQTLQAATGTDVTLRCVDGLNANAFVEIFVANASFKNFTFDGNWAGRSAVEGDGGNCGILLSGCTGIAIENVRFVNYPSYAVWSYNSQNHSIQNCIFEETWQGIRIDGNGLASAGVINNCSFINTTAYKSYQHCDLLATNALAVTNNSFIGAGMQEPTSHGFEGTWGNSLYLVNTRGFTLENNDFRKNHWSSIVAGAGCANGIIQRNYCSEGSATTAGVWVEQGGASAITVTRNTIYGGLSVGDGGGDFLTITKNHIMANTRGIDVNAGCKVALIQHNIISARNPGSTDYGVFLWGKETSSVSCVVKDNVIFDFDYPIFINNFGGVGPVWNVTISGNYLHNFSTSMVGIPATLSLTACAIQSVTVAPSKPAITTGITAPNATTTAFRLSSSDQLIPANSSGFMELASSVGERLRVGAVVTTAVWGRAFSGTLAVHMGPNFYQLSAYTLTTTWSKLSLTVTINNSSDRLFEIVEQTAANNAWELWHPVTAYGYSAG